MKSPQILPPLAPLAFVSDSLPSSKIETQANFFRVHRSLSNQESVPRNGAKQDRQSPVATHGQTVPISCKLSSSPLTIYPSQSTPISPLVPRRSLQTQQKSPRSPNFQETQPKTSVLQRMDCVRHASSLEQISEIDPPADFASRRQYSLNETLSASPSSLPPVDDPPRRRRSRGTIEIDGDVPSDIQALQASRNSASSSTGKIRGRPKSFTVHISSQNDLPVIRNPYMSLIHHEDVDDARSVASVREGSLPRRPRCASDRDTVV